MALPAAITYGQVKWHAVAGIADTDDVDALPDEVPVTGTVTFTPTVRELKVTGGADPVTVFIKPVTASVIGGRLEDDDGRETVTLISPSSSATPVGWQWVASFNLAGISKEAFAFNLPAGTTVDLTAASPVAQSGGTAITQGPQGEPGPTGPTGPAGPTGVYAPVVQTRSNVSGAVVVDLSAGRCAVLNLTGNVTSLSFSNISSDSARDVELHFVQDATGGRTLSGVDASINLAADDVILSTTPNWRDIFQFHQVSSVFWETSRSLYLR